MTEQDRDGFGEVLAMLGEVYNEPVSAGRAAAYWLVLKDLPLDVIHAAIDYALRRCKFFPRPAELRELCGVAVPDAGLVNALLSEAIAGDGKYRRPKDPFLLLVYERLGSAWGMPDPEHRQRAIEKILPAVTIACQLRGIAMPTEAREANLGIETRALDFYEHLKRVTEQP